MSDLAKQIGLQRYSRNAFILVALFISIYRISNVQKKEIAWDALGYYLYLPATFIYDDPMMDDPSWIKKINDEKQLTGTLYQISSNDEGEPMYFFLMGMAYFFLPFFLMAHGFAYLFDYPMDGFSEPYQYLMVIGAVVYTIIGLYFFRKILRHFFSDKMTAILMLLVVFATNYVHHLTLKNLETVNILFMLASAIIWFTICWHEHPKLKYLLPIGVGVTLMSMVKPSEVVIVLIPLLWHVSSKNSLKEKWTLIRRNGTSFLIVIGVCLLFALPQMMYWYAKTGSLFYDSYKNPGVGLDVLHPHILDSLFSYRKGWLVYTPLMITGLIGFYFLYKRNRKVFVPFFVYFLITFYIIVSWTEWFYGAGFSNRPLISTYPIMAVCIGYLLLEIQQKKKLVVGFSVFAGLCLLLNQFQWWQFKSGILDPYRTTKEFYWASFLATEKNPEWEQLKLVNRPFNGTYSFNDRENYIPTEPLRKLFERGEENVVSEGERSFLPIHPDEEFSPAFKLKYSELTKKDHVWIECSVDIRMKQEIKGKMPFIVMTMEHHGQPYAYYAPVINEHPDTGVWNTYKLEYLTPEPRRKSNVFKCYLWNSEHNEFDIDNFELNIFERKDGTR